MKKKKRIIIAISIATCLLILYAILPFMAGFLKVGDRDGPVIYNEEYHTVLYILGHEVRCGIKPRESMVWQLYNRPYFYFCSRRPKSKKERESFLKKWIERYPDSTWTKVVIEENNRIISNQSVELTDKPLCGFQ